MSTAPKMSPPPPPDFDAGSGNYPTLTMGTIETEEPGPNEAAFRSAFDEGGLAFARCNYDRALHLFEEALRLQPGNTRCLKNIELTKTQLAKTG